MQHACSKEVLRQRLHKLVLYTGKNASKQGFTSTRQFNVIDGRHCREGERKVQRTMTQHNQAMAIPTYKRQNQQACGFTLIELLVTLAIAAILATLAAPSLKDFIVRSKLTNVANEFTSGVLRSRNEAVGRNTCVTMCMSSATDGATPQCTAANADWQVGWIAFLNPSCDSGLDKPADVINMLLSRQTVGADFLLQAQGGSPTKKIMFNSRGSPGLGSASQFNLLYKSDSDPMTVKYGLNLCMDGLGRTRSLPADKTCSNYK